MTDSAHFDESAFREKVTGPSFHVGVIGLGYVGLPLVLTFVEQSRLHVTGFDTDPQKIARLRQGESYIEHLGTSRVSMARASGRLDVTSEFELLSEQDAIVIAVPTPLTPNREPDLSYVKSTVEQVARKLRPGQLVVLESTTYPGTTAEVVLPILERSGLKCGVDFLLAFSPEREDPGNREFHTAIIPKLVGGMDRLGTDLTVALYEQAFREVVRVSSPQIAEAAKLMENVFRAVNIALVNELKLVYDAMGIDIWQVLDAAATKPFGYMRFDPGPGLGGHCIALDPFYLAWRARQSGIETRFVELAGEINLSMPRHVVQRLAAALSARGRALATSQILILGVAYKPDVDDTRESPAFEVMSQLVSLGATVKYHDPHVPCVGRLRHWPDLPQLRSEELAARLLADSDAVVVITNHRAVDYELVLHHAQLIVDARGVYRTAHPKVIHA